MDYMEVAVQRIQERNRKVEADKAWEVSWTRRLFLALLTYATATLMLWMIGTPQPWLASLFPPAGYLISTFSLPPLKKWWLGSKG